jgi:molybdopterin synthase sulfur carrier subunit
VKVHVGSILFEYTGGADWVEAEGETVDRLIDDLERRFPGLAFRVRDEQGRLRPHLAVFLDKRPVRDGGASLAGVGAVHLLGALSGG